MVKRIFKHTTPAGGRKVLGIPIKELTKEAKQELLKQGWKEKRGFLFKGEK